MGRNRRELGGLLAIGGLALLLLLPGARNGYWDRDEAEYAAAAHAMAVTGDFVVPRLFGRLDAEKPPLAIWLTALSFRAFGETELAGRLPHLLLAAGSAVLVTLLGRRLLDPGKSLRAGLMFATSLLFVVYGRMLLTDSALLFFDLAAILCLLREGPAARAAGGVCLGLAILAKGPVALLAPALFVASTRVGRSPIARPPGTLRRRLTEAALFVAACAAVALPWFLLAERATRGEIIRTFFWRENLARFLHPMEGHRGPWPAYLAVLVVGFHPWSGWLAGLLRKQARRSDSRRAGLIGWAIGILVFFSISATKLPHYLLPALPAFALLCAGGDFPRSPGERAAGAWTAAGVGALLFLAAAAAITRAEPPDRLLRAAIPFAAAALLALALPLVREGPALARSTAVLAVAGSALLVLLLPPALEEARCLPRLGREAAQWRLRGEPLGGLGFREPSLEYYAGGDASSRWTSAADAASAADRSPTGSVLAWASDADGAGLARAQRMRVRVLAAGFNGIEPGRRGLVCLLRISVGPASRRPS